MELRGRVALVTGAGKRLGRAMALALAEDGADVLLHYHRSRDEAEEAATIVRSFGRRAVVVGADVCDRRAVEGLFERLDRELGRLDVLVNSASIFERTPWDEVDEDAWERSLAVNLTGPFRFARLAAPRLAAAGDGLIVNLVDGSGVRPWRQHLPHSVSKAGLVHLTLALARELAPTVRANAICPGAVLWPEGTDEAARRAVLSKVPLAREGAPADVVHALRYLVAADYVTGEILHVDGGREIR